MIQQTIISVLHTHTRKDHAGFKITDFKKINNDLNNHIKIFCLCWNFVGLLKIENKTLQAYNKDNIYNKSNILKYIEHYIYK